MLSWAGATFGAGNQQVIIQGMISDRAEAQLQCVFAQLPQDPDFRSEPLLRAQRNLLENKADGYFGLPFDPELLLLTEPTRPLLIKKWSSYSYNEKLLALDMTDPQIRVGVIDGGNPMNWLHEQGIKPTLKVQSAEQLLELLHRGRLDIVLTDEYAMQQALDKMPELPPPASRFQRFVALSMYFTKTFIASNSAFIAEFDRGIDACKVSPPALSTLQQEQIQQWAAGYLGYWRSQPGLLQALRKAAAMPPPSPGALEQADARWLLEQQAPAQPLISQMLSTPLSMQLRRSVTEDKLLDEAMVADVYGQLLAASGITTDFYQGDEASFQESRDLLASDLFVEPITYDESTHKLAIRVSGPIRDVTSADFLGVLTLGVDVAQLTE